MFRVLVAAAAVFTSIASIPSVFAAPAAQLQKRTSGRATYYAVGLGACGSYNVPSDFIVALNEAQFTDGNHCGQGLTITYNGKSAHATVMDECPSYGCNYGDLDMSEGLFTYFASEDQGVFQMEWYFDGQGGDTPTPQQQQPSPTPTPTPDTPTWTYTPPTTTSSSSSSSSSSSTSTSSSSSSSSSDTYSAEAVPSSSEAPQPQWDPNSGSIAGMNKAAINMGNFLYAAYNA